MKYSKFPDAKESQGLLFWQVATLWQRKIKEALRPYDLTHTHFVILAVTQELHDSNFDVTQKEISDFSSIDVMTLSATVRLLEKKGLVTRKNHSTDTRAKQIINTPKGETLLKQANQVIEAVDEQFFFKEKTELKQFMLMLNKLKDNADTL